VVNVLNCAAPFCDAAIFPETVLHWNAVLLRNGVTLPGLRATITACTQYICLDAATRTVRDATGTEVEFLAVHDLFISESAPFGSGVVHGVGSWPRLVCRLLMHASSASYLGYCVASFWPFNIRSAPLIRLYASSAPSNVLRSISLNSTYIQPPGTQKAYYLEGSRLVLDADVLCTDVGACVIDVMTVHNDWTTYHV
jgi:hypothetical protein